MKKKEAKKQPITTREAAFEKMGLTYDPEQITAMFALVPEEYRLFMRMTYQRAVCMAAHNDGVVLKAANTEQYKHYPWYWVEEKEGGSGVALSLYDVSYVSAHAGVAPRLAIADEGRCREYVENFKDLEEEYFSA